MSHHKITWLNQPGFTGETLNPIRAERVEGWEHEQGLLGTHCEKCSPGCTNCYAEAMNRRCLPGGGTGLPYTPWSRNKVQIYLDEEKLNRPFRWKKARCIFWCSMTDLFGEWVPDGMIERCLEVMCNTPEHRHIILTKRPHKAHGWDCGQGWLLASASTQTEMITRSWDLLGAAAGVTGLSIEPLLTSGIIPVERLTEFDWVLVGCESGPRRRPCELAWVRSLVEQCHEVGVACFVKQVSINGRVSRDPAEWPEDIRVQEFPG